ncbi:hypothetical protein C8J56DRAFT_920747 [Mycena floridula]|nr:hypothetical protein C8J56DRAFT_920747 [Mycena floridula]
MEADKVEPINNGRQVNQILEVPDDEEEARLKRLDALMKKLSDKEPSRSGTSGLPQFDFGKRETFPVEAPTELISRIQAFLPQLEAANDLLAQSDPRALDIECIEEDGPYVEMNLGLGVFEDKTDKSDTSSSDSSSSDDSDSSSDSDSDEDVMVTVDVPRPIRPLPKRSRMAEIVMLPDQ